MLLSVLAILCTAAPAVEAAATPDSAGVWSNNDWAALSYTPLSDARGVSKRQSYWYCTTEGQVRCEDGREMCKWPGWHCCKTGQSQCRPDTRCLDTIPGSIVPPTPSPPPPGVDLSRGIQCCPNGVDCTKEGWLDDLISSGLPSTATQTSAATSTTTAAAAAGPVITVGAQASVSIDLKRDVVYTGAWYAYAWAYAWCSVWGPGGQRVTVSSQASVATVNFGADVQAVAVSISESADIGASWKIGGDTWVETGAASGSASASAGVDEDGGLTATASANCKWTRRFRRMSSAKSSGGPIAVTVSPGTSTDSWCQLNAVRGYKSEEDMFRDPSPGSTNPAPGDNGTVPPAGSSASGSNDTSSGTPGASSTGIAPSGGSANGSSTADLPPADSLPPPPPPLAPQAGAKTVVPPIALLFGSVVAVAIGV